MSKPAATAAGGGVSSRRAAFAHGASGTRPASGTPVPSASAAAAVASRAVLYNLRSVNRPIKRPESAFSISVSRYVVGSLG
eukprot:3937073-Rhodomonas_salina.2